MECRHSRTRCPVSLNCGIDVGGMPVMCLRCQRPFADETRVGPAPPARTVARTKPGFSSWWSIYGHCLWVGPPGQTGRPSVRRDMLTTTTFSVHCYITENHAFGSAVRLLVPGILRAPCRADR